MKNESKDSFLLYIRRDAALNSTDRKVSAVNAKSVLKEADEVKNIASEKSK